MTIKSILAPLTGAKPEKPVLNTALAIAKRFDAHIDVLHIRTDPRDAIPYLGEGISGAMIAEIMDRADTEIAEIQSKAHQDFESWRSDAGLPLSQSPGGGASCSWQIVTGAADQTTAIGGRYCDLVVVPGFDDSAENELQFEATVMECGRALVLAPPNSPKSLGDRIVIAWDGSAESARAVSAALPFLVTAKSVSIVTISESGKTDVDLKALARYLSWHGVDAETKTVDPGDQSIGEAIMSATGDADLLVMGAYSHSRLRELVFGGATRHVMETAELPVLMAH
ncbi:MAG: universal stress protein [Alphaproteobacteria bacterium]|nr:universal stress protein [Alphaproteobacteria bacterium]